MRCGDHAYVQCSAPGHGDRQRPEGAPTNKRETLLAFGPTWNTCGGDGLPSLEQSVLHYFSFPRGLPPPNLVVAARDQTDRHHQHRQNLG